MRADISANVMPANLVQRRFVKIVSDSAESKLAGNADGSSEGIQKLLHLSRQQLHEVLVGFEEEVVQCLFHENEQTIKLEEAQQQLLSNGNKFDAVITGKFGDLSNFKGGLDVHIGLPDPKVFEAITRDHEQSADSKDDFESGNHGLVTTPQAEFEFVVRPQRGKSYAGLEKTAHGGPGRMPIELDVLLLAAGAASRDSPADAACISPENHVKDILEGPHGAAVALVALTAAGLGEFASRLWTDLGLDWRSHTTRGSGTVLGAKVQDVIEQFLRASDGWEAPKVHELIVQTLLRLRKSRLSREELICLRLYSGPMYFKVCGPHTFHFRKGEWWRFGRGKARAWLCKLILMLRRDGGEPERQSGGGGGAVEEGREYRRFRMVKHLGTFFAGSSHSPSPLSPWASAPECLPLRLSEVRSLIKLSLPSSPSGPLKVQCPSKAT